MTSKSTKPITLFKEIEEKGYTMARIKNCKDPISGYLPGTEEHRAFMRGWHNYINDKTNKERNSNDNAR
jgi:hypothetical protein